jgi:hypothetical protein
MLRVIGDSHSVIWSGNVFHAWDGNHKFPNIKVNHLGPLLAYHLWEENSIGKWGTRVFETIKDQEISALALSFGEIDIRTRSVKMAQDMPLRQSCEIIASRILNICAALRMDYDFPIFIMSPIASGPEGEDAFGTPFERNLATLYFNNYLKTERFSVKDVFVISIAEALMTNKLETKTQYYSDKVHLNLEGFKLLAEEFNKVVEENQIKNPAF